MPWLWILPGLLSLPPSPPLAGTGCLEGVMVCYFPFPCQVRFWLNTFPWGQALLRITEYSGLFQNGFLSPPLAGIPRWLFSIYCRKLVELLKTNLTILWGAPYDWVPLEFLTQICPQWAASNSSITVQFSLHCFWSLRRNQWVLLVGFSDPGSCNTLYLPVSPIWGQHFALWPHFSDRSKKSCWCFHFI